MNAILKKFKSTTALVAGDSDGLAALERTVRELSEADAVLTRKIITLEKTAAARLDQRADIAAAEALLAGEQFKLSYTPQISQIAALHAERDAVRMALKLGNQRLQKLRDARAIEIQASYHAEIAELERRRLFCALDLQAIDREREMLRNKIRAAGGEPVLPTDGADLLGIGDRQDNDVLWCADRLVAEGIASAAEIEKVRSDG
jgi:hypothetical protein